MLVMRINLSRRMTKTSSKVFEGNVDVKKTSERVLTVHLLVITIWKNNVFLFHVLTSY